MGLVGFTKGLGKGLYGFGEATVTGIKDLGVAGYQIATDPAARAQAWDTTKKIGSMAADGAESVYRDPKGAYKKVRDAASGAVAQFQADAAKAEAEGRLSEFYGQAIGRYAPEIIPISKISKLGAVGKVVKAEKVVDAAADTSKAVRAADKAAGAAKVTKVAKPAKVQKAVNSASKAPKSKAGAKTPCPGTKTRKMGKPAASKKAVTAKGKPSQAAAVTPTGGCPISMATGEELLTLEDFRVEGPVELPWTRFYRSGQCDIDLGLGHGWLMPLSHSIEVDDDLVVYHDAEGRRLEWALPAAGEAVPHANEDLVLKNLDEDFVVCGMNLPDRWFRNKPGKQPLQSFGNESGQRLHVRYAEDGRALRLESTWGMAWLLEWRGKNLSRVVPAAAREDGEFEAIADALVSYEVDAAGDLLSAKNRLGQGERYQYKNHLLVSRTLPSGFVFKLEWEQHGADARCLRSYGEKGIYDTRFEWLPGGVSRAIDSRGGVTEYLHNDYAKLLQVKTPEGRVTTYRYDADQHLVEHLDGEGHSTRYGYNDWGRLTSVQDALGHKTKVTYDLHGKPQVITDALEQVWMVLRDEQGRVIESRDPLGGSTKITYNDLGLPAQLENAVGQKRTLLWDQRARLVGEVGFDGVKRSYQHDAEGRISSASLLDKRKSRYAYDPLGRLSAVTGPDGGVTRFEYDAGGNLIKHIDATGRYVEFRFDDGLPEPTERRNALGEALRYQYDTERNLVALINPLGETYRLTWDRDEYLIGETGFDGRKQRYEYGAAGHLLAWSQWDGQQWETIRYERDPLGRLLRKLMPSGAAWAYRHDALGRLTEAGNPSRTVAFAYDAAGRVVADGSAGQQTQFEYDAGGRITCTVLPDGRRLRTEWNPTGRMAATRLDEALVTAHEYDELAQETTRQQGALTTRFAHDEAGRLATQRTGLRRNDVPAAAPHAAAGPVLQRDYRYDPAGRLAEMVDNRGGISRYVYDPAARLTRVDGSAPEVFAFDPAGHLLGMGRAAQGAATAPGRVEGGRLLMVGDRHFRYDAHGNRIEERRGKGGHDVRQYHYDDENRMVEARGPAGVCKFIYDALGRRIAKVSAAGTTHFVYDGNVVLAELGPARESIYIREEFDEHRIVARVDGKGSIDSGAARVVHFHLDVTGRPCELSNAGNGRLLWSARYRAYGALAAVDVAETDNPFRLPGQYFDEETELHWSLFRYYDHEAGVFASNDPIGLAGGMRAQGYPDNPANWVDPLGLACKAAAGAANGLPEGITYSGTVQRAVNPRYVEGAWDIHAGNIAANHRYSGIGRGALYAGTSKEAVLGELAYYGIDANKVAWASKNVKIDNVLDLTNPAVRNRLGISLEQITSNDYLYTQAIGDFARGRYAGILAPSARQAGASHLVILPGTGF